MLRRVLTAVAAVVLLAGCSGESKPRASATPSPSTASATPVVATAKPDVTVPAGPVPDRLKVEDLVKGAGEYVFPGQVVNVHYVGLVFRTGHEFESTWEDGHPFAFRLGDQEVMPGLDQGVVGMRVGGRRRLLIPSSLVDPTLPPFAPADALVVVVDLMSAGGTPS